MDGHYNNMRKWAEQALAGLQLQAHPEHSLHSLNFATSKSQRLEKATSKIKPGSVS
jgi:hypothetical protein